MANSLTTVADVVNYALASIGVKESIGSVYDGDLIARKALDTYSQALDEILRDGDWQFNRRDIVLELQKTGLAAGYFPPNDWNRNDYPPPGWMYQYTYPEDCVKIRAIRPAAQFVVNFDPRPVNFSTDNDPTMTPQKKVILCNVQNARMVYAGRVTNPSLWEPTFLAAFASKLAVILAPVAKGVDEVRLAAAKQASVVQAADNTQG